MSQIYIKNKDFYYEIMVSKKNDKLTPLAENMMILLANRTIKKMKYFNYQDKEDCLQTGLMILFSNWRNFDENKSTNAFAYFTEIFKRALAKGYNDLHKLKGDPDRKVKKISIQSCNEGDGLYNL